MTMLFLACHADQSLNLLEEPSVKEKEILNKFTYVSNKAFLHTDENLMPLRKKAWSSWNSITKDNKTCVTYWLNKLQNLKTDKNYFLTLNPVEEINQNKIIKQENLHTLISIMKMLACKRFAFVTGEKKSLVLWKYFGYGFHEDGLKSSMELIKNLVNYEFLYL